MQEKNWDIIIGGSGPAGATAGTLLSQYGYKVLILERDSHPRFHIGESMLPMSEPVFQRLGVQWDCSEYLPKGGAEFVDEKLGASFRFGLNSRFQPYQVERAKFDEMMIKNAVAHGATLHEKEKILAVDCREDGVSVGTDKGEYTARYFIDATGRSSFMGRKHKGIDRISNLGKFSLYTHYSNMISPEAEAMFASGDIKILMLDIGWFWVIPLVNKRLSLGIVVQKDIPAEERKPELFEHRVAESPFLQKLLKGAKQETGIKAEADFSFSNHCRHGLRYACCGDSAGFLDPVFSSGAFLAVTSAERVADRIHQGFEEGREADPELHKVDDAAHELGFHSMRLFVERFYQSNMVHNMFFAAEKDERVKNDITQILSGNLWAGNNAFQQTLLDSRRANSAS